MINVWSGSIVLSPNIGPFVAALVIWKLTWPWAYWILAIMNVLCLIAIVAFMDESFYDRIVPATRQPLKESRVLRLVGFEQWKGRHQRSSGRQLCVQS